MFLIIIFFITCSNKIGCTRNRAHTMLHCGTASYDGRHMHKKNNRSAQYDMQCCSENMCNENITFRELPPIPVINELQKDDSEKGKKNQSVSISK